MLLDPDMVENIIATTPGLNKDMVVLSMFTIYLTYFFLCVCMYVYIHTYTCII